MRNRTVFGLIMLLMGILTGARPAHAGLRFCNQSTIQLSAAVGYVDREKGWVAKGWMHIEPGECKDALRFKLDNRFYYYYANGRDENSRIKISGENSFCIESRKFTIYQADYGKSTPEECAKDGLRSAKFKKVDVEGKPEFTVNLAAPDSPPPVGGDPAPAPGRSPVVVVTPPAVQPSPAAVQPPPAVVQQPPAPAARPATPSAQEESAPQPPRRRARQEQPGPDTPPAPPAAQGGGPNGTACQRFPNLC